MLPMIKLNGGRVLSEVRQPRGVSEQVGGDESVGHQRKRVVSQTGILNSKDCHCIVLY